MGKERREWMELVAELRERLASADQEIERLTARLAAAEAALQPFAKVAADIDPKLEDYMAHHYDHLVGHYRAAAEAAKGGRDE